MRILLILLLLAAWTEVAPAAELKAKVSGTNSVVLDDMGFPTNPVIARQLGQTEARRDLTNGVLKIKSAGLPAPSAFVFSELIKERCHCELQFVCGCMVSDGVSAYIKGYNEISKPRLYEKFGTNILDQLDEQAEHEWSHPSSYEVKKGDVLLKIARAHGVTLKALMQANPKITSPRITPGQRLVIPAAEPNTTNAVAGSPKQK